MKTPTKKEIQDFAKKLFPTNKEMQSSFILGTYHTIYTMKTKKKK